MIIYKEKFKLRQSDFDCNDNFKASSYLDLFQTVASEHAEGSNMGFDAMKAKNIAWVITKARFDALLPLRSGEVVTVESLPHPAGRVDYTRDYYIYNEKGELAVKGSSQWVLIDFISRRIVRPCVDFEGEFSDRRAYDERLPKIDAVDCVFLGEHTVDRLDLDHNGHANNIRYADMIMRVDESFSSPIRSFVINFISECYEGDIIKIYTDGNGSFTGKKGDSVSFTVKIER